MEGERVPTTDANTARLVQRRREARSENGLGIKIAAPSAGQYFCRWRLLSPRASSAREKAKAKTANTPRAPMRAARGAGEAENRPGNEPTRKG